MNRIWVSKKEAISWSKIQQDDMTDIVQLVRNIGYDPRSFFVAQKCKNLDFRGSDIEGVSFLGANLNDAFFYSDQLELAVSTGPAQWDGAIEEDRLEHITSEDSDANLWAEETGLSPHPEQSENFEKDLESALLKANSGSTDVGTGSAEFGPELTEVETGFASRLGHSFSNPELLARALTHSSAASRSETNNQRFQHIGGVLLELVVTEALYAADQQATVGKLMPRIRAVLDKTKTADIATEIDLGRALRMGASELKSGGRRKVALLSSGMEAALGAIYVDAGLEPLRETVLRLWARHLDNVEDDARDAKTALQEWAAAHDMPLPTYTDIGRDGPDHAPLFTVEVRLSDGRSANGQAAKKKDAQAIAAKALLDLVQSS